MSLTENELLYLMAYVDHQVDDDELPEVIDLLERSEEARLIVAQHEALGDWVRTSSDRRAAEAGADRIATYVLAEVESLGGSKVIEIERQRAKVALQRQRVKEFTTLFAVAAVFFAFWAMPTRKDVVATNAGSNARPGSVAPPNVGKSKAPADVPSAVPSAPSVEAVANGAGTTGSGDAAPPGALASNTEPEDTDVDVQSVDSDSPFSIFYVPAASGTEAETHSSSVVVWIGEGE